MKIAKVSEKIEELHRIEKKVFNSQRNMEKCSIKAIHNNDANSIYF